jgi:hypothetical protein
VTDARVSGTHCRHARQAGGAGTGFRRALQAREMLIAEVLDRAGAGLEA